MKICTFPRTLVFPFEDQFTPYGFVTRCKTNQVPCMVVIHGFHLVSINSFHLVDSGPTTLPGNWFVHQEPPPVRHSQRHTSISLVHDVLYQTCAEEFGIMSESSASNNWGLLVLTKGFVESWISPRSTRLPLSSLDNIFLSSKALPRDTKLCSQKVYSIHIHKR